MHRPVAGFTLLEIMFVLFVTGLLVGLTAPRFGPQIERFERHSQGKELEDQLRLLPRRVRLSGRPLELPKDMAVVMADGEPALRLPQGWEVRFSPPLRVAMNGACSAATAYFLTTGEATPFATIKISDLTCELQSAAS